MITGMEQPEVAQPWSWQDELAAQERDVMWLARKTGIHYRALYRIYHGEKAGTVAQLATIAKALGRTDQLDERGRIRPDRRVA